MGISIQANGSVDLSKTSQLLGRSRNNGQSAFDKQITKLQEQIKKVQEDGGLDADSKKLKIKEIEEQIKEIEKQKQTKQLDDLKKSLQEPKNNTSNEYTTRSDSPKGATYELSKALIEGDKAVKSINKTNAMRKDIINEMRIAEVEDTPTPSNEKEQSRLQKALARTTESLYEQIGEANSSVSKSGQKIAEANETEKENREVENGKETSVPNGNITTSIDSKAQTLTETQSEDSNVTSQNGTKKLVSDGAETKAGVEKTAKYKNHGETTIMKHNAYKKASSESSPQVDITV